MFSAKSTFSLLAISYLLLSTYIFDERLAEMFWPIAYVIFCATYYACMKQYSNNGAALVILTFASTYLLAPLPYFLFEIPIVGYLDNVNYLSYLRTLNIFLIFMVSVGFFGSNLNKTSVSMRGYERDFNITFNRPLIFIYWSIVLLYMYLTFKGESVTNISGENNYDVYTNNLGEQGGALEYFFILMGIGYLMSYKMVNRVIFIAFAVLYLYFCITRGFRIQVLEMLMMIALLFFKEKMTFKNVVFASFIGFFLFQALGYAKHGMGSFDTLFTIYQGQDIRMNQTEVFYSSNNVINAILNGNSLAVDRIYSLVVAFLAFVVPAGLLPSIWHTTVSTVNNTGLPTGGGGFIAGHYYYWLSWPGVLLSGFIVANLFKIHQTTDKSTVYLFSVLLLSTFPRWIAYEPIALFFRLGMYYWILVISLKFLLTKISDSKIRVAKV
jgi:hypothetical protein